MAIPERKPSSREARDKNAVSVADGFRQLKYNNLSHVEPDDYPPRFSNPSDDEENPHAMNMKRMFDDKPPKSQFVQAVIPQ